MGIFDSFNDRWNSSPSTSFGQSLTGRKKQNKRPQTMAEWGTYVGGLSRHERSQQYPGMHKDLIPSYEMITGGDPNWGMQSGTGMPSGPGAFGEENASRQYLFGIGSAITRENGNDSDVHSVNRHGGGGSFGKFQGPYRIWGQASTYGDGPQGVIELRYTYIDEFGSQVDDATIAGYSVHFDFVSGKHPEPGTSDVGAIPIHNPSYLIKTAGGTSNVQIVWRYHKIPLWEL